MLCCAQSCLTLCNHMVCSSPGSSVHGIFQARILEWLPFPPPGDLPVPGMETTSLASPALASIFFSTAPFGKLKFTSIKKKKLGLLCFAAEITSSYFLIFPQYLSGLSHSAKTKLVFLLMLIFKVNNIHIHFWLPFCLIGNIGWVLNSIIFYQFSVKHGVIVACYKSNVNWLLREIVF